MSLTNTTKMANRYGLNLKLYEYSANGSFGETALATIDFANEVSLEISGDITWATGGQAHSNQIGFKDPYEGTLKVSTQIVNGEILKLVTNTALSETGNGVSFKNDAGAMAPKYYMIKGETVWQGEDGTTYTEEIKCYKACVKPGYSVTYNGSGDPQSLDVEFQLGANSAGKVVDIDRADVASGS